MRNCSFSVPEQPKAKTTYNSNFRYQARNKNESEGKKVTEGRVYNRNNKEKEKEKEETISQSQSQSQTIESVTDDRGEQPIVKRYHRRYRETKTSSNTNPSTGVKNGNNTTTFNSTSHNSNTVYSRHRKK